jgi:hypothetical protein
MRHIIRGFNIFFTANGRENVIERSNDNKTINQSDVVAVDCCKYCKYLQNCIGSAR